jgi:hypothetical protein
MSRLALKIGVPKFSVIVLGAVLTLICPAAAQQGGPFSSLAGQWAGGGSITLGGGARERIRCRAEYEVGEAGATASISLRCASDSYSFDLQGSVRYRNGEVKGQWSERTRGMAGHLSGSAKGGQVDVRVEGQTFAALLSVATRGDKQSISIRTAGGENQMSEASLTLNRRG